MGSHTVIPFHSPKDRGRVRFGTIQLIRPTGPPASRFNGPVLCDAVFRFHFKVPAVRQDQSYQGSSKRVREAGRRLRHVPGQPPCERWSPGGTARALVRSWALLSVHF